MERQLANSGKSAGSILIGAPLSRATEGTGGKRSTPAHLPWGPDGVSKVSINHEKLAQEKCGVPWELIPGRPVWSREPC